MNQFNAWHLPGLRSDDLVTTTYQLGDLPVCAPVLTPEQLTHVLTHVGFARASSLSTLRTRDIVAAIDAAAARFADRASAEGAAARSLLPLATGYASETIEDILQHMVRDWRSDSLNTLLRAELYDPEALDKPSYQTATRRHVVLRGPHIAYQVFSGNVPGVAVTSMIRCLLVKAAAVGKTASGEPVLPVLFAHALADVAPPLAESVAVTYWPGGTHQLEDVALRHADTVIVYGGAETVASIRSRMDVHARLVVHGPKLSLGLVGRTATVDIASAIAYAVAAYDQQGCVSPHVVYVERDGVVAPKQLAHAIAAALADLAIKYPRRKLTAAEAVAIRAARTKAEFRAIADSSTELLAADDTSYTVVYDEDATLIPSCLNRTLYVKAISNAAEVAELLERHRGVLQSVAIAGFSANQAQTLTMLLANCGVTRVTTFELLPWPPMWWHHDGNGPLHELLTWHDLEL